MTTYYARANLNDLTDTTGWSLSSGGPSASAKPTSTGDTVIFDANSGPSRTITGGMNQVGSIYMYGNPMTLTAVLNISGTSILNGVIGGLILNNYNGNTYQNQFTLDASQCVIGGSGLQMSTPAYWMLTGNLTTTGTVTVDGSSGDAYLTTNNQNITCARITASGGSNGGAGIGVLLLGAANSSTITVTGATTDGTAVAYLPISHLSAGTPAATLILTDKSSAAKLVFLDGAVFNLVNDTANAAGTGGVQFIGAPLNFSTFNAGKGALSLFTGGYIYTAANWILDGAGQYSVISSTTSASPALLAKSGGGTIAANFCNFLYISAATSSSPVTAIRATNSKYTGGGVGLTLVGMTSRFMPFF